MLNMIRVAVVDDDVQVCSHMEEILLQIEKTLHIGMDIETYISGNQFQTKLKNDNVYHLIFLDIELTDCTGIDISLFIREEQYDDSVQIVYISGKEGYDRQLFEFRPLAFLEKPLSERKVLHVMEKYMRICDKGNDIFSYRYGRDLFCVKVSNILYFQSDKKQIIIKTIGKTDFFNGSLKNIYSEMKPKGFVMPNRSYVVNYRMIDSFQPNAVILVNGEQIPVSRNNKEDFENLQILIENGEI